MFTIIAFYKGRTGEEIDSADTLREAEYLVGEYSLAYGPGWTFQIVEK